MSWITMLLVPLTGARTKNGKKVNKRSWLDKTSGIDTAEQIVIQADELEPKEPTLDPDDDIIIEEEEIINGDENGEDKNGDDSVYFNLCDVNPNLPFCPNTGNDNTPIIKDTGSTTSTTKVIYDEGLGTVIDIGHSEDTSTVITVSTVGQANIIDTAIGSGVTSAGAGEESELTVEVQTEEEKQQDIIVDRVRSYGFQTG